MKRKLFILGLIMMCATTYFTGCDESETTKESTIETTVNPENMSDDELADWVDGGDVGSDEWYQEHYGNN